MKVYVITAVHNRYEITRNFVNNLNLQKQKNIVLVLVVDGSTDGTSDMVINLMPNAVIIKGDGNLWWGGALQKGYKWIKENCDDNDIVFFSNDDVKLNRNYIYDGVKFMENSNNLMLSGIGISRDNRVIDEPIIWNFRKCIGTTISEEKSKNPPNCTSTRSLFIKVKDMKLVGGFHPILLPHYGSDYEWTMRAVKKGVQLCTSTKLNYITEEGSTGFGKRKKLTRKEFWSKKNIKHPIYRINFILLITPTKYLIAAIYNQLKRYLSTK